MTNREKLTGLLIGRSIYIPYIRNDMWDIVRTLSIFSPWHPGIYTIRNTMISLYSGSWVKSSPDVRQLSYGQACEFHFSTRHSGWLMKAKVTNGGAGTEDSPSSEDKSLLRQVWRLRPRNGGFWLPHYPKGKAVFFRIQSCSVLWLHAVPHASHLLCHLPESFSTFPHIIDDG